MKKNSIFFISIVSIALLSGCAKERDNYDKYLTDGTWTMSSIDEQSIEVETFDYVCQEYLPKLQHLNKQQPTQTGKRQRA
jgi:PBP1b-binding outer membrane lipoprotein LpoB